MTPKADDVKNFLETEAWSFRFDSTIIAQGRKYWRDQRVSDVKVELLGDGSMSLIAEVFGSAAFAYETEVVLWDDGDGLQLEPMCSCPYSHGCKHSAALLFAAGRGKILEAVLTSLSGGVQTGEFASERFDQWLDGLKSPSVEKEKKEAVFYRLDVNSGSLYISVHVARLLKDGSISGSMRLPSRLEGDLPLAFAGEDKIIVKRLLGYGKSSSKGWKIEGEGFGEVLDLILETGRCLWREERESFFSKGESRQGQCDWLLLGDGEVMQPVVLTQPRSDFVFGLESFWYVDPILKEVGEVQLAVSVAQAKTWISGPDLPRDQAQELAEKIEQWDLPDELARPAVLDVVRINEELVPELTISRYDVETVSAAEYLDCDQSILAAKLEVSYGGHKFSILQRSAMAVERVQKEGQTLMIVRDPVAEGKAIQSLERLGLFSLAIRQGEGVVDTVEPLAESERDLWFCGVSNFTPEQYWTSFRLKRSAELEAEGWAIRFEEGLIPEPLDVLVDDLDLELEDDGGGWFTLSAGFSVGGKDFDLVPILADLLELGALRKSSEVLSGEFFHYYPEGRSEVLRLPCDRLRMILGLLTGMLFEFSEGRARVAVFEAAELSVSSDLVRAPKRLKSLGERLKTKQESENVEVPLGLQATLRPYQEEGFRWMQFLARHELHGILADDMGLGKTMQTLAHILAERDGGYADGLPALVIAPTSVVGSWKKEAKKFAPSLKVLVLQGSRRKKYFDQMQEADVVLTSFALLGRDVDRLKQQEFHLLVLDEAQYIKNPKAQVSQAACQLKARHRLCLSGTPIENHLSELWSLMSFLMPGLLGEHQDFVSNFRTPIEKQGDEEKRDLLVQRVGKLILRRTKDEVATELPPKTELLHSIELNTAQKDLYETVRVMMDKRVRDAITEQGVESSQIVFLDALLKLRQICCHPQLLDKKEAQKIEESAKMEYLFELLDTLFLEGRRVLLFSQFTTMLDKIEAELVARSYRYLKLTGESKNRQALVDEFQAGKAQVFLISLKAGGTGLTLTAADTVIHYDPWWNPAAEAQATDRAYRIGQDKPVFVHKLICQGTVEQRIQEMQAKKAELAGALLERSTRQLSLTEDMVADLLKPLNAESDL